MKKKMYVFGLIIIIILGVFFDVEFGGYYNTPEEALKHNSFNDTSMKNIVETVWVEDRPIIFYVSNNGKFCEMEFSKKEILGKTGWKSGTIGILEAKTIDSNGVAPTRMGSGKFSDGKPIVLFGITKSPKAKTIKVNGEIPTFKDFEIEGDNYILWYNTIKLDEPNIDKVKITSDLK